MTLICGFSKMVWWKPHCSEKVGNEVGRMKIERVSSCVAVGEGQYCETGGI